MEIQKEKWHGLVPNHPLNVFFGVPFCCVCKKQATQVDSDPEYPGYYCDRHAEHLLASAQGALALT